MRTFIKLAISFGLTLVLIFLVEWFLSKSGLVYYLLVLPYLHFAVILLLFVVVFYLSISHLGVGEPTPGTSVSKKTNLDVSKGRLLVSFIALGIAILLYYYVASFFTAAAIYDRHQRKIGQTDEGIQRSFTSCLGSLSQFTQPGSYSIGRIDVFFKTGVKQEQAQWVLEEAGLKLVNYEDKFSGYLLPSGQIEVPKGKELYWVCQLRSLTLSNKSLNIIASAELHKIVLSPVQ
jgi:hypothetical protein